MKLSEFLRRMAPEVSSTKPAGIRGRIRNISIVAGGEVSVVVRFGLDEPKARQLAQGALVELQEVERGEVQQQGKGGSGAA